MYVCVVLSCMYVFDIDWGQREAHCEFSLSKRNTLIIIKILMKTIIKVIIIIVGK
jgi:hypothetical protein